MRLPSPSRFRVLFCVCAATVLVLSLLPPEVPGPTTGWDKSNHVLAFGVLTALAARAWPGRPWPVVAGLLGYGGLIEVLQALTSYREASWFDLCADAVGIGVGMLLSYRVIRA
ncbi:VanZ family protein [Cupriavidus agavae]|uniref:VanZ like protein n=1 Tax=Cupriavidus agavae TaxID=1001822 RepID=A0A4Q7S7K6_9BURK|nr:VanZ family protein [Cupriavidus agavae]RZT42273.1 VanZ like protein [Cupriavidus agavae]